MGENIPLRRPDSRAIAHKFFYAIAAKTHPPNPLSYRVLRDPTASLLDAARSQRKGEKNFLQ